MQHFQTSPSDLFDALQTKWLLRKSQTELPGQWYFDFETSQQQKTQRLDDTAPKTKFTSDVRRASETPSWGLLRYIFVPLWSRKLRPLYAVIRRVCKGVIIVWTSLSSPPTSAHKYLSLFVWANLWHSMNAFRGKTTSTRAAFYPLSTIHLIPLCDSDNQYLCDQSCIWALSYDTGIKSVQN